MNPFSLNRNEEPINRPSFPMQEVLLALMILNFMLIGGIGYFLTGTQGKKALRASLTLLDPLKNIGYPFYRKIVIGRKVMKLNDRAVSEHHCIVKKRKMSYIIQDLRSTNGTFLNKRKIKKSLLRDGDVIEVGKSVLIFNLKKQ
jgi:hypothetical protein